MRTYRSIERCDVVIYLIDAEIGLTRQDIQILMQATKKRKGIICAFNKWDLIEKDHRTMDNIKRDIVEKFGDLRFIPVIFTSVHEKKRIYKALDLATEVYDDRKKRIPTAQLNDYFGPLLVKTPPPATRGKEIKIKYITQVKSNPPLFVFYSNYPNMIAEHYKRFIENRLREQFGFTGVPLTLSFREK